MNRATTQSNSLASQGTSDSEIVMMDLAVLSGDNFSSDSNRVNFWSTLGLVGPHDSLDPFLLSKAPRQASISAGAGIRPNPSGQTTWF
jgi:hypothetical protein